jgi:hypothetical protein
MVNGPDFHFSASPTVTTGFIAFAFDIRKEQEVQSGDPICP